MDWLPTFLAAAGETDVKEKLLTGHQAIGRDYKVHLDGYNFLPYLTGEIEDSPRNEIFYFTDDGDLSALRPEQRGAFTQISFGNGSTGLRADVGP